MTKPGYTHISILLDASGSMAPLKSDTLKHFNTFLRDQKALKGEATLTLATFNTHYTLLHDFTPLKEVAELTESQYQPNGGTALCDSAHRLIDNVGARFATMKEEQRAEKVLVLLITDGEENASRTHSQVKIAEMVDHQQSKYGWNFSYVGANVSAWSGAALGINAHQTYSWTSSSIGSAALYDNLSFGVSAFRNSAAAINFSMTDPNQSTIVQSTPVVVGAALPANGVVVPSTTNQTVASTPDTTTTK